MRTACSTGSTNTFPSPILPLLPAKTFDLGDSHPFDAKLGQRFFHLFELERLNDSFQFFHVEVNSAPRGALQFNANGSTRSHSNNMKAMQASFSCPLKIVESLKR